MTTGTSNSLPSIPHSKYTRSSTTRSTPSNLSTSYCSSRASGVPNASRRDCLTSLSALYRSTYKPYQFTHMYNTKYNDDFQGRYMPPPLPERQFTARYAAMKYASNTTTYQQEFQDKKPMGNTLVVPCSRNRKHRPHPKLRNIWQYPDSSRWVWSSKNSENFSKLGNGQTKPLSAECFKKNPDPIRTHRWYSR